MDDDLGREGVGRARILEFLRVRQGSERSECGAARQLAQPGGHGSGCEPRTVPHQLGDGCAGYPSGTCRALERREQPAQRSERGVAPVHEAPVERRVADVVQRDAAGRSPVASRSPRLLVE